MARGAVAEKPATNESDSEDLSDQLIQKTTIIRGREYTLRELSQEEYDACAKMATGQDGFDSVLLLKLMLSKALLKPKSSPDELKRMPFKVTNELRSIVNRMHWGDDEIDEDAEGNESSTPEI